jgi:glycosyltransferase involved in cell wall biosynthesis
MVSLYIPVMHSIDYENASKFDPELSSGITRHYMLLYKGLEHIQYKSICFSTLPFNIYLESDNNFKRNDSFTYIYNDRNRVKSLRIFLSMFNKIISIKNIVLIDPLQFKVSVPVYLFGLLLKRKRVVFITDSPIFSFEKSPLRRKLSEFLIRHSNGAIVVNNQLKELINPQKTKSLVIESFVDESDFITPTFYLESAQKEHTVLYAGGISSLNGIANLLEVAKRIDHVKFRLCGPITDEFLEEFYLLKQQKNIKYIGILDFKSLALEISKSSLLINPRTNNKEYTKYSLPIKIPTYLSSGVPVMTTLLAGIPKIYNNYMITLESNSPDKIQEAILDFISLPVEKRIEMGVRARDFIIKRLSYKIQADKISKWLNQL